METSIFTIALVTSKNGIQTDEFSQFSFKIYLFSAFNGNFN